MGCPLFAGSRYGMPSASLPRRRASLAKDDAAVAVAVQAAAAAGMAEFWRRQGGVARVQRSTVTDRASVKIPTWKR